MTDRTDKREARGFVLVGVVMMVLALTILGFSLFGLSSYEAQFLNRSLDSQQALQLAMGGLERARFALSVPPTHLDQVKTGLTWEYVVAARATQLKGALVDSTGPIDWNGSDVEIQVTAVYRGFQRTVAARYQPTEVVNYYKRLMSVGTDGLVLKSHIDLLLASPTIVLDDSIWQNTAAPAINLGLLQSPIPSSFGVNYRYVPTPDVADFLNATTGTAVAGTQPTYSLGQANEIRFYRTHGYGTHGPISTTFSNFFDNDVTVDVSGLVVWMMPNGMRVSGKLRVESSDPTNSCLVIVGGRGTITQGPITYNAGVWFFGGLESNVPLILVSNDVVKIEQNFHPTDLSFAPRLSIFAKGVQLTGPVFGTVSLMTLGYDETVMDPIIDRLMQANAIPNSVPPDPFAFRPGSWRTIQ